MIFINTYHFIGKGRPLVDAWETVAGKACFTGDLADREKTLHGLIIRSPYANAEITDIDVTEARDMPGVTAILTPDDTPDIKYGLSVMDEQVLTAHPLYIGDEILALAAISPEIARAAAEKIKITYRELPGVKNPVIAAEMKQQVHPGRDNVVMQPNIGWGNPQEAWASSKYKIGLKVQTQRQAVAAIEPYSCIASWMPASGLLLRAPLQDPANTQAHLARICGLPMAKVRIIQPAIGGSFGSKLFHRKLTYICSLLAIKSSDTVYMAHTMEEELAYGRPRVPADISLALAADEKGFLTAELAEILADNGAYSGYAPGPVNVMVSRPHLLYRIPNLTVAGKLVYTNTIPTGSMRGFGNITMLFALESAVDELARQAGMDPVAFRLLNIHQEGQTSALGWQVKSSRLKECLEQVGEKAADWRQENKKHPQRWGKGIALGVGIAAGVHVSSNRTRPFDGACARVTINEDGSVTVFSGDGDVGQGIKTIQGMIVAEVLQLDPGLITVTAVDTAYSPFGLGVFADRGTTISGKAVQLAAQDAREKLLEGAAVIMGVGREELYLDRGHICSKGGEAKTMKEIAAALLWRPKGGLITGIANYDPDTVPLDPAASYHGNPSTGYTFCAQAVEAAVDLATGAIRVLRICSVHDSGKIINPIAAKGQVQGGILQGLGFALTEELKLDEGRVVNANLRDYKLPGFADLPELHIRFVESWEEAGPFGAKGLGQTGCLVTAPAVANALFDAAGIRLTRLPMTPERVWQALRSKGKEGK